MKWKAGLRSSSGIYTPELSWLIPPREETLTLSSGLSSTSAGGGRGRAGRPVRQQHERRHAAPALHAALRQQHLRQPQQDFKAGTSSSFIRDGRFNEIPADVLDQNHWSVVWSRPWKFAANILKARALLFLTFPANRKAPQSVTHGLMPNVPTRNFTKAHPRDLHHAHTRLVGAVMVNLYHPAFAMWLCHVAILKWLLGKNSACLSVCTAQGAKHL